MRLAYAAVPYFTFHHTNNIIYYIYMCCVYWYYTLNLPSRDVASHTHARPIDIYLKF